MLKIKNQKKDPSVPPISVSALLDLSSIGHLDDVVVNQKEFDFTRRELKSDRDILAKAFLQLGVKKGDIITVATSRSMYENILIFFAANKIGAVVSYFDEKNSRDTILHYLEEFKSEILITHKYGPKRIKQMKHDAKSLKHVINMDGEIIRQGDVDDEQTEDIEMSALDHMWVGKQTIRKVAAKFSGHVPKNAFATNNEALISFTSGSTSGPKPMVFTNKALISSAIYSKVASEVKMWDKELHSWMSYVKFDCPYGLVVSVLAPICGGGEVILTPDIDESNMDYYFGKNANTIFGVPSLLEALPHLLSEDTDLSGLKLFASGGERLEKSASLAAMEFFKSRGLKDVKISNGYGVGEALGLISTAVGGTTAYRPESVGQIPAGVHVTVLDIDTGEELGFGKTGMLYVTGKHIMKRYHNRPELDEEKIKIIDGRKYVKTGDLAYVTETGFITLVGRATFFINNLPDKVYYEVVRAAVSRSDLVSKCYVVKGPDKKLKLAAYAFVVTKEGVGHNNQVRRQIVTDSTQPFNIGKRRVILRSYEIPRKVIFLDDLPLTRANKTDFRKLERMAREMGEEK